MNPSTPHRDAVTVCEEGSRSIRTRTHKYVHHVGDKWDTHELYDLVNDPNETQNLVTADPDRAARLRARLSDILGLTLDD